MDNFDLRTFLAEGKLHEAMSPQDVVDIADTVAEEFTIESADEGDFLVYSVGKMDADDMSFELDTDVTSQTPKSIDTRGVGEGWGGIFRIKPTADGYEVRNAEKGGLVAMIDNAGNFKMLSAAESRAELLGEPDVDYKNDEPDYNRYMEEGEEEKSNKMKKSELKEMIRAAFLNEATISEDVDMIPAEKLFALIARDLQFSPLVQDNVMLSKEDAIEIMRHVIAIEQSDISPEAALGEYIASGDLNEAKGDMIPAEKLFALIARDLKFSPLVQDGVMLTKEQAIEIMRHVIAIEGSDISAEAALGEYIASGNLNEAEGDEEEVDVEAEETEDVEAETDDVAVDDTETVDVEAESEISPEVKATQDALTAAIEAAKALGDQKLADQIGNSITFFTRTHVVGKGQVAEEVNEEIKRMQKLAGIKK